MSEPSEPKAGKQAPRVGASGGRAAATAVFIVATVLAVLGVAWGYARVFAPEPSATASPPIASFDPKAMRDAVKPGVVAAEQTRILELGSRYLGQPGMYAAERYLDATFRALGLEVHTQAIRTLAPRTAFRELYRAGGETPSTPHGQRLGEVEVYPFMPNHLQPVVTPDAGVTGELVLLDEKTLATRARFDDVIGLLDAGGGVDQDFGFNWARYAQLGVKALIVSHRQGLDAVDWAQVARVKSGLVTSAPVNAVRVAATPGIFAHVGERVRLRVRVDYVEFENRTLFGVLKSPKRVENALVVYAPYDAPSILPDLAPGPLPALNLAYLVTLAQGLAQTRDGLERDVIFASSGASVMGEEGLNQLLRVLQFNTFGSTSNRLLDAFQPFERGQSPVAGGSGASAVLETRLAAVRERQANNDQLLAQLVELRKSYANPAFLKTAEATRAGLARLPAPAKHFFDQQFEYVLGRVAFERQEPVLSAKIALERRNSQDQNSAEFQTYLKVLRRADAATAAIGSSAAVLLSKNPRYAAEIDVRARAIQRFDELRRYHELRRRELEDDRGIAQLFSAYREFALMRPQLVPEADASNPREVLTLQALSTRETQSVDLLLQASARGLGIEGERFHVEPIASSPSQTTVVENNGDPSPIFHYFMVYAFGYQPLGLYNLGRQNAYRHWASPVPPAFTRELESLSGSFAAGGELLLYLAHGNGLIGNPQGYPWQRKRYGGKVLVANVGQSLVPSFPLAGAVLGARSKEREEVYSRPGFWANPFYKADPYGRFDLPEQSGDFGVWWQMYSDAYAFTPLAVGYGADGLISHMKDEGEESQRLFKSVNVPLTNEQLTANVSLVTFRAAPLSILDLTNPQNFKDYAGVQLLTPDGLTPFKKSCQFIAPGLVTTYLPPDARADIVLQSSRPDNEYVKETRAFLIGDKPKRPDAAREIDGTGYLVQDHAFLLGVPSEAAKSMERVNGQRLALANRYGMADARTNAYQDKTRTLLRESQEPGLSARKAALIARDATSYAGLNHPVLRQGVFEAVVGVLFYLALLVPFVFFAEKLLFCFADVRRQIAAQVVIFLVVFGLLRLLHPAFQMVRSSLMILLGFVIMMISLGITLLFTSRAQENLKELRKRQGKVSGAEVNKLGVLAASFLVGLNNMHRRKVRTGLTAATLVLLTFVMICFTSTQNDLVDETVTTGRAEYQGLLSKHENFEPMSESELFALKSKFADRFQVSERRFFTGDRDWNERRRKNPVMKATYQGASGAQSATVSSVLRLGANEPLRNGLKLLTKRGWFSREQAQDGPTPCPVLIPDRMAERLGVSAEAVDAGDVTLLVNERPFLIQGIFSADSLGGLKDLDGYDLLPFDIERVSDIGETSNGFTAPDDSPRVSPERVLIAPLRDLKLGTVASAKEIIASVAVDMKDATHRQAKQEIDGHLEKTALPAYYGLDGVSYRGLRTRKLTLAGLLDLLVPLLLAGLTVLNTMRGSVYERRSEIYVYNAVGVAPRYILSMFFAEAFVYAVVGAELGYLLSQGVGRALTALGWTGGLNMTFTSLSTIYATLSIIAAVFISTWFPARQAMEIAAPAEDSGWKLPEPSGDVLEFDLPFNFRARGRLAVLAFFRRFLAEHGEGSAGPFFAGSPELFVAEAADPVSGGAVPEMRLMIWLKPFDLAVSEELVISTPFDQETSQFKARIALHRKSGTREAWLRLNGSFVAELRRHFLHWRAVPSADRDEMFVEAKALLEARYPQFVEPTSAVTRQEA